MARNKQTTYSIDSSGDAANVELRTHSKRVFNAQLKWLAKYGKNQRTTITVSKRKDIINI